MTRTTLAFCALGIAGLASAADAPHYRVAFDAEQGQARVALCLAQAHAQVRFAADSNWAMRFLSDVARSGGGGVDREDGAYVARDWHAGECLDYVAAIDRIAATHDQDVGWRIGDDRVTAPQLWLLRADAQGDADATLALTLPSGWALSAPWQQTGRDGDSTRYRIANTPPNWSAAVAFGKFAIEPIELPGGTLRLTILSGADDAQRRKLHDWLDRVSRAILSAYGRLPLADVQVLVIPVSEDSRRRAGKPHAVFFGQSIRGQGNALELLVDPTRPAAEYDANWIAVHELSHLMHPYLGDRGAWLAEGLATYYQNILRGRSGLLTRAQAWDRLREGFMDEDGKEYDDTLEHASANMFRTHAFDRIYWSGAAYWLTVDRDLRRDSGGKVDMAVALAKFRDCCLPAHREWKPEDFTAKLDALLGVDTFSRRYREFAALKKFPDWRAVYTDLGIRADAGGHLQFVAGTPDAAVRDQIVAPK